MDGGFGFNEILKHINELSMKLDVNDVLCKAEAISLQMMKCKDLPSAVCEVLGLKDNTPPPAFDPGEDCVIRKPYQNSSSPNSSVPAVPQNGTRSNSSLKLLPNSVHTPSPAW